MAGGRGWHGDQRGHREAATKGVATSKAEMHRRLASLKLEFLRYWDEGSDLAHAWWFIYHSTLAIFWTVFSVWFKIFGAIGRGLKTVGKVLTWPFTDTQSGGDTDT